MANIDLYKQKLVDIADAIREQLGETDTYKLEEMPDKILSIESGGSEIEIVDEYTVKTEVAKDCMSNSYVAFDSINIANGYNNLSLVRE